MQGFQRSAGGSALASGAGVPLPRTVRGLPSVSWPVLATSITPPSAGSCGGITTQVVVSVNGSGGIARR